MGKAEERRQRFSSRLAMLMTMMGVAIGLGNVWRFPYMTGKFGGASFVLFYVLAVVVLGLPGLMAEWSLGRHTRRGPVGAFERVGFPGGRRLGWFFFFVVTAATAYYTNAVGWVLYHAAAEAVRPFGASFDAGAILPPAEGFEAASLLRQVAATCTVILASVLVLLRGLRSGIETTSKVVMPLLFLILLVLIARSVTLPGAAAGIHWYILKFDFTAMRPGDMLAAIGQAIFSLSLGGTFMVVFGSYLGDDVPLRSNAAWTAAGDLGAGLLAGFAIMPAVFALGLEPASGPGLLFVTLPRVFAELPFGWLFGLLFFLGLFAAAFLSVVAAFEVLVAGLVDNTRLHRKQAVWTLAGTVLLFALPPMVNMEVFVPWDLFFGTGMQTFGALVAAVAFGWFVDRGAALRQLTDTTPGRETRLLYLWIRWVIPAVILTLGVWWLFTDVFAVAG